MQLPITGRNANSPIPDKDRQSILGLTDLACDAWGRQKVVTDYSLFQGLWTFDVPTLQWVEYINNVINPITHFTSLNGMLNCQGTVGQSNILMSKRHPRYQANRGYLYSVSMILPTANNGSIYNFGVFYSSNGVFFRVTNGLLYAVRRTLVNGVVNEVAQQIVIPTGIDITKGNIYDIQMQWRGVGNIYFFINQILVYTMPLLGTLSAVSISNPALPISFEVIGIGTMYAVCVDVTSEGGNKEVRQRGAIDSGEMALAALEVPVALIYLPDTIIYNTVSVMNTRDVVLRRISAFADTSALLRVYTTRLSSKFTGTTFTNYDTVGALRYSVDGSIIVDTLLTGLTRVVTKRVPANGSIEVTNPDEQYGNFFLTSGDYLLVTMQAKNATTGGASIEWGTEI